MIPFTSLVHCYGSKHIGPIFIQHGGRVGVVMIVHLEWPSGELSNISDAEWLSTDSREDVIH